MPCLFPMRLYPYNWPTTISCTCLEKKAWQINQIAKKREKADPEDQICQALDPYVGKTSHFGVINFVSDKSEPTNCFPSMT